ncbi:MAG TPA: hypothetical protein VHZ07_03600 [Bryobacteraceae bacterium]|nr:hypothetical protein [Bryobacteraceae bacterium]
MKKIVCKTTRLLRRSAMPLLVLMALFVEAIRAQNFQTNNANDILQQFANQRIVWTTNIWVYANALFGILAVIEFA